MKRVLSICLLGMLLGIVVFPLAFDQARADVPLIKELSWAGIKGMYHSGGGGGGPDDPPPPPPPPAAPPRLTHAGPSADSAFDGGDSWWRFMLRLFVSTFCMRGMR